VRIITLDLNGIRSAVSFYVRCRPGSGSPRTLCWRLDYRITPCITARARTASVYNDLRFSDRAPLTIDHDYTF
jgi:exonuclease III